MNPEGRFDYQSMSEQDDRLDCSQTKTCPHCKKAIAVDATICYFCGQDFACQTKRSWVSWVVGSLIAALILSMLFYAIGRR